MNTNQNLIQNEFRGCANCNCTFCKAKRQQEGEKFDEKTVKIQEVFQELDNEWSTKIRECKTMFSNDTHNALVQLCALRGTFQKQNCVRVEKMTTLSKHGRIKLPREYDLFTGLHISCEDPSDIKRVTLFAQISNVPDYETKTDYIPIKVIKNPKTNYIHFFDNPTALILSHVNYSIEVQIDNRLTPDYVMVQLNYMICDSDTRNKILKENKWEKIYRLNLFGKEE